MSWQLEQDSRCCRSLHISGQRYPVQYLYNFMLHRDARINKYLGQRYSLDLYDPMGEFYLQEAKPLFKKFTGWVGRILGVVELGVDRIPRVELTSIELCAY